MDGMVDETGVMWENLAPTITGMGSSTQNAMWMVYLIGCATLSTAKSQRRQQGATHDTCKDTKPTKCIFGCWGVIF